jgi:hypothetical protein
MQKSEKKFNKLNFGNGKYIKCEIWNVQYSYELSIQRSYF